MRYLIALIIFGQFNAQADNSFMTWEEPVLVAEGNSFYNNRPRVAVSSNNYPIIIWGKISTGSLYISKYDGTIFSSATQLNPSGTEAFISDWAGPEISAKGDTVFVVFKLLPEDNTPVYIVRSTDGGATFGDTVRVENLQNHESRFPSVSIGNDGNPIVSFMKFLSGWLDPQYAVSRSVDGGQSFESDTSGTYLAPGEVCDCCPASITTAGNRHVLSFRNNDNNLRDAWISISKDDGASFAVASDIDDNGWMIFSCPSSGPESLIAADRIITVWMSGASGVPRVYIGLSDFNANQLDSNVLVNGNVPGSLSQNYPKIAGSGDTIGIVWLENYQGSSAILFRHSSTGVSGLSAVDTIAYASNNALKNPEVTYLDGTFHIVYQNDQGRKVMYQEGHINDTTVTTGIPLNISTEVRVAPNPFSESALITWDSGVKAAFAVYDLVGEQLRVYNETISPIEIEKNDLKPGLYFLRCTVKDQEVGTKKIVIR